MKRSQVVLNMARFYTSKFCMVENGYMTKKEFFDEMLQLVEQMGMIPPMQNNKWPINAPTEPINWAIWEDE